MELKIAVVVTALAISSCSSNKTNLSYFYDLNNKDSGSTELIVTPLRIVPDDALLITVNSFYPEATAGYNVPMVNPSQRGVLAGYTTPQQQTYIVDSKGDINFPILGKIHVEGMTTEELSDYIGDRISADVVDPYVHVELTSFKIQVLGEVNKPGTVNVTTERFTLLDALAQAGDLTAYGRRENVLLIRQENGQNKYYHINLNDSGVLSSPLFYLKQNDVLIVEPNDIKKANSKYNQDNAYKLSVISTIVSAASVVASLAIALAVK